MFGFNRMGQDKAERTIGKHKNDFITKSNAQVRTLLINLIKIVLTYLQAHKFNVFS